jgi:acetoin utilization deacetylase AcuC-like enzyme
LHRNFPLPPGTGDAAYLRALDETLALVRAFGPESVVVSAGMDIYVGDPLGDFAVTAEGIRAIGRGLAALHRPTVVVMEGGYNNEALGENVVGLLSAFGGD